ncbi:MAG: hypothetical protein MHMPM18_000700 [Marteilia pararefringens]
MPLRLSFLAILIGIALKDNLSENINEKRAKQFAEHFVKTLEIDGYCPYYTKEEVGGILCKGTEGTLFSKFATLDTNKNQEDLVVATNCLPRNLTEIKCRAMLIFSYTNPQNCENSTYESNIKVNFPIFHLSQASSKILRDKLSSQRTNEAGEESDLRIKLRSFQYLTGKYSVDKSRIKPNKLDLYTQLDDLYTHGKADNNYSLVLGSIFGKSPTTCKIIALPVGHRELIEERNNGLVSPSVDRSLEAITLLLLLKENKESLSTQNHCIITVLLNTFGRTKSVELQSLRTKIDRGNFEPIKSFKDVSSTLSTIPSDFPATEEMLQGLTTFPQDTPVMRQEFLAVIKNLIPGLDDAKINEVYADSYNCLRQKECKSKITEGYENRQEKHTFSFGFTMPGVRGQHLFELMGKNASYVVPGVELTSDFISDHGGKKVFSGFVENDKSSGLIRSNHAELEAGIVRETKQNLAIVALVMSILMSAMVTLVLFYLREFVSEKLQKE